MEKLLGAEASEQRLKELERSGELETFSHLVFATHGVPNVERAFESALELSRVGLPDPVEALLSGKEPMDGRLTAAEVMREWDLDAELVTLTACQSAIGRYAGGEGYLGFSQAFLLAGARSVLLTLWKVDDTATTLLVRRFYENLLVRKLGKAKALREAQKWLRGLEAEKARRLVKTFGLEPKTVRGTQEGVVDSPVAKGEPRPYEDPYYWAAFILVGDWD